jgi:hypothetical protein
MRRFPWLATSFARVAVALLLTLGTFKAPVQEAVARSCAESTTDSDEEDTREAEEGIAISSAREIAAPKRLETRLTHFAQPQTTSVVAPAMTVSQPSVSGPLCARLRC